MSLKSWVSDIIISNIWVILSFGIGSLGKITVVIQFKVLSKNSPGEPEENQPQVHSM